MRSPGRIDWRTGTGQERSGGSPLLAHLCYSVSLHYKVMESRECAVSPQLPIYCPRLTPLRRVPLDLVPRLDVLAPCPSPRAGLFSFLLIVCFGPGYSFRARLFPRRSSTPPTTTPPFRIPPASPPTKAPCSSLHPCAAPSLGRSYAAHGLRGRNRAPRTLQSLKRLCTADDLRSSLLRWSVKFLATGLRPRYA